MKIRTDFVTNSSSSSFIAIKVKTADKTITEKLDSGYGSIIPGNGGYFKITEEDLNGASDIKQVLEIMCKWFYATLEDPSCWDEVDPTWSEENFEGKPPLCWEDCRQILKYYGNGKSDDLLTLKMGEIKKISFFSRMEYWDEPYGASLVEYDYETKGFKETHCNPWEEDSPGEDERDGYPNHDSYGEELEELFRNEDQGCQGYHISDEVQALGTSFSDGRPPCDCCGGLLPENEMFEVIINDVNHRVCKDCLELLRKQLKRLEDEE